MSYSIKTIVLGDSSVGKTCILLRYVYNQFQEFNTPTVGASFLSKTHTTTNNKTIKFQIWDTAGQERYKSIAPIYFRDSQVALCVYDISSRGSFEVMKTWIETLSVEGPKELLLVVVGNKADRIDHEEVPYEEAKTYANGIEALFKLTSAKDNKGIEELFSQIAVTMLKRLKEPVVETSIVLDNPDEEKSKLKRWKYCCRSS